MYEATGIRRYHESDVNSLGPEKLIVMLYEAIAHDSELARRCLDDGDIVNMLKHVKRIQDILGELRNSLDFEIGGEIAQNLESLYEYMFNEYMQMMADKDPAHLDHSLRVLTPLLEAWRQIPPGTAERARRELVSEATAGGPIPAYEQTSTTAPPTAGPQTTSPAPEEAPTTRSFCYSA